MGNRLLVVDGDPKTLRVLDVSLRAAGFDVEVATTGAEALVRLEHGSFDLVVADTQLAEVDGFELALRMRQNLAWSQIPLLFLTSDQTAESRIRSVEVGADDYLVKPAYVKEMMTRIEGLLRRSERARLAAGREGDGRFAGSIADIRVVDLVQLVEGSGRSGVVHLAGPAGAPAALYFRQGKVVDAEVGRLSGADALYRLFAWTEGTFEIAFRSIRRRDVIEKPPAELIVEGMERLDEWNRLLQQLPGPGAVFEVDYRLLAERLAEIPDELNGILRLFDGTRTAVRVIEDSGFPDMEALSAMSRLYAEGIIYDAATRRAPEKPRSTSPGLGGWLSDAASPFRSALRPGDGDAGGSGPVRQSFAERLEVEGQDAAGSEEAEAPATPRRTAPGMGGGPDEEREDAEVADSAARTTERTIRDTALEWPQPADADAAIPSPRVEPDNLIHFPAQAPPSPPPGRSSAPFAAAGEITHEAAHAHGVPAAETAAAAGALDVHGGGEPQTLPAAPVLSRAAELGLGGLGDFTTTQPGIGPAPVPSEPGNRAAEVRDGRPTVPSEVPMGPGRLSLDMRLDVEGDDDGDDDDERPVSGGGRPAAFGGDVARAGTASATGTDTDVRPARHEDEISRRDALDELGVSSRTRVLAVLGGALAVGAFAAVLVYRMTVPAGTTKPAAARPTSANASTVAAVKPAAAGRKSGPIVAPLPPPPPTAAPSPVTAGAKPGPAAPPVELPAPPAAAPAAETTKTLGDCRTAFNKGRLRDALAACSAVAAANPDSADALVMLAHTQLNLGHGRQAMELAQQAATLDPRQADAYVIIGGVQQDDGHTKEAKAAYRRYLELAPKGRYAEDLRAIVGGL
jgi:CheY-like chemotaxis protein